ncbi:Uncharacterised protein [Escherichia coli]|nr:Uncharacterised protein [Escherichia coli]
MSMKMVVLDTKFLYEGDDLKCYEHGLLIESVE